MDEDYEDIRDELRQHGLTTRTVEFIITNAQITNNVDKLREELGVEPRED
jgi:hypothetical protein